MMDRAWTRLQALPDDAEPLRKAKVTARMFIQRGWPNRARSAVEQALTLAPQDPEVAELARQASTPPRPPPLEPPDVAAPYRVQLQAAEAYLSTGAYLRGRRILENLDRIVPGDARVGDLLWALQGDYDLAGTTLSSVVAHYVGHIGAGELSDLPDEAEPTDSDLALIDDEPSVRPTEFPNMFRAQGDDPLHGDSEDTQASLLLDFQEEIPTSIDGEDTQVLRVVKAEGSGDATLAERPTSPGAEELEEEDDVVVLLRRGEKHGPPKARRPLPPPPSQRRPRRRATPAAEPVAVAVEELEALDEVDAEPIDAAPADDAPPPDIIVWLMIAAAALFGMGTIAAFLVAWLAWT